MRAGTPSGLAFTGRRRLWLAGAVAITAVPLVMLPSGQRAGAAVLPTGCVRTAATTITCTYTADHVFTVPPGTTSVHAIAVGAHGQAGQSAYYVPGPGGPGAQVAGHLLVTPGEALDLRVDTGGGAGGIGYENHGGRGGGESAVGTAQNRDLIVAGGGGGGGGPESAAGAGGFGGTGACHPGTDGHSFIFQDGPDAGGGGGGCQSGGPGGSPVTSAGTPGGDGSRDTGGPGGGRAENPVDNFGGGGGGAGFYGGGGGGGSSAQTALSGGGGGGSSVGPEGSVFTEATGQPRVVISYEVPPLPLRVTKTAEPATFTGPGQLITDHFTVTNTGSEPESLPVVVDSQFGTVRCQEQVLPPGQTTACEPRTHITTEADVARGRVSNTAYARASDGAESAPVTVTVELARSPVAPVTG